MVGTFVVVPPGIGPVSAVAILFLASNGSSYMAGSQLVIDGGISA